MTMKNATLLLVLACAAAAAGCTGFEHKSTLTEPSSSPSGISGLVGVWTSGNIIPSPDSCTAFEWHATEQTPTSARGDFSATCASNLKLQGTAEGTLSGSAISWSARGNASAADLASCAFTLTGTAELGPTSVRIPYSGDTCLGKVSGVETLHRK
jgi:hypothetical protein